MKSVCIGFVAGAAVCAYVQAASGAETENDRIPYSFCSQTNCADGENPFAGLIAVNGKLYGTTASGGASRYGGTVFSFDTSTGAETVLYSFGGSEPEAGLTDMNGILYGTTVYGGAGNHGTIFSLDLKTGKGKLAYSFCSLENCADGYESVAGLVAINGKLYGTTLEGGAGGLTSFGTVFSFDPKTGTERVVHSFCVQNQNCTDGAWPYAGLIVANGILYGTTYMGGTSAQCQYGCGAVFEVNPGTGKEKVLYSFCPQQDCTDGYFPYAGLISVGGNLYGTTAGGGAGFGTVFAVDPKTGVETVVYSFQGGSDGFEPYAGLIDVAGTLYGTTLYGGTGNCSAFVTAGCGTVFSVNPSNGGETVLHSFRNNGSDGIYPYAGLTNVNGKLYSTTANGGFQNDGTVFEVRKP